MPRKPIQLSGIKCGKAARRGAKMIVCDPRRIDLVDEADYWLQLKPGTDIPLLNGLMHIIIKEGLEDKNFAAERTERSPQRNGAKLPTGIRIRIDRDIGGRPCGRSPLC